MKTKQSGLINKSQLISPSSLKYKPWKYQAAFKRKLRKFVKCRAASQNWEITDSLRPHSIAKCEEKTKEISSLSSKNDLKFEKNVNELCTGVSKSNLKEFEANFHAKPSIIKMTSSSIVCNVLKNQFSHRKHNKNDALSLKSLINNNKGTSSVNKVNCLQSLNNDGIKAIMKDKTVVDSPFRKSQLLSDEITCIESMRGSLPAHLNEYSLIVNFQNKITSADIYELSGFRFLVVVKPDCHFYVIGIIELELLTGSVEILGYNLDKPNEKVLLFSPQGSCHLDIKTKKYSENLKQSQKLAIDQLSLLGLSLKSSMKVLSESANCTLFIISKSRTHISSSVWPKLFENYHSFYVFAPNELLSDEKRACHILERQVDCIFDVDLNRIGLRQFVEVPEWTIAVKDITSINNDCPRTIVCGGKSVGKSTLLRYLINKCIQKWSSVLVLDFDLGQCEFTIGGCISIVLVQNSVLGPNYTHLKQPLRSVFLGEIDVTKCPENYIEGCKSLINFSKLNYNTVPWLVNTMGFTKGFGVTVTCGIIRNVNPTHVIEIESRKMNVNFPTRLTPGFVNNQNVGAFSTNDNLVPYKYFAVPSGAELRGNNSSKARGMSPAEARNLVILSYFSEMLNSEISSFTQVLPYMINMNNVHLQTTNKYKLTKAQLCATMNGNLVALCISNDDDRFAHCPGFGIVRGIDQCSGTLSLITPLRRDTLGKINCLVKGNIALPESLLFSQGKFISPPYLVRTSNQPTSRFAKRDFRTLPVTQGDIRRHR